MASGSSINEIKKIILRLWQARHSVMIWGEPGIGKSDGIRQIAAETTFHIPENPEMSGRSVRLAALYGHDVKGRDIYDVRLLLCQPTDIKGIPVYNPVSGRGEWVNTGMFPTSEDDLHKMEKSFIRTYDEMNDAATATERKYELRRQMEEMEPLLEKALKDQFSIVFLDEISIAPKMVQGAALQLVLDRTVGTYKLPETVSIVAAGNRSSDRSGATAMSPPLASRFDHLQASAPDFQDWVDNFAQPKGVPAPIIGFLKFKPGLLHDYKPDKMTGSADAPSTFPCPRTWVKLGEVFNVTDALQCNSLMLDSIVSAIIGEGASAEFVAWLTIYQKLPDPNDVLDGKLTTVDFNKLARDRADEPEREVRSRALSLRYAFFHALATQYMKRLCDYVDAGDVLRAKPDKAKEKVLKDTFYSASTKFFRFVNADENDVEYGMVIINSFILQEAKSLRILGELRSMPDADAKSNLDRILRVIDQYRVDR